MGTDSWSQCNDTPVKFARFPVTGLIEGRSYIFRVRAVNKNGIGLPSRVSEPVAALDPAEKARLKSKHFSIFEIFLNFFFFLSNYDRSHYKVIPPPSTRGRRE